MFLFRICSQLFLYPLSSRRSFRIHKNSFKTISRQSQSDVTQFLNKLKVQNMLKQIYIYILNVLWRRGWHLLQLFGLSLMEVFGIGISCNICKTVSWLPISKTHKQIPKVFKTSLQVAVQTGLTSLLTLLWAKFGLDNSWGTVQHELSYDPVIIIHIGLW